jgi:predicted oxidoreductase
MKPVLLSDSGPKVSPAVYSFWRWKEKDLSKIDSITKFCLDLGINTFDLADIYADGVLEEAFGKSLIKLDVKRENVVLFSKCGLRKIGEHKTVVDHSPAYIRKSIDASLQKLGTDYIDIFLLNEYDHLSDPEQTAMVLSECVHNGKIKHIGVANFSVFQHQLLASYLSFPVVTNHIEMNLIQVSALQDGRLDYIKQQFSKPLVWSPLAGGEILEGIDGKAAVLKNKLKLIGEKYNSNIEQTAVAWLMQLGTLPIIGSLSIDRIQNVASATDLKLSREDWYDLYHLAIHA